MPKHYIVLGAGISGLSLAWSLQKEPGVTVTIIEKESRPGGWIETLQREDFIFDRGPRSCRTRGAGIATLQLIEELGLENEVIAASPAASFRYLYLNKRLQPLPTSPLNLLFSPLTRGLFKALWRDLTTRGGPVEDESIASFVERRLGRPFAERLVDPFTRGIFAGDMHRLSLRACFPILAKWEAEAGGVVRGMLTSRKRKQEGLSPFIQKMLKTPIFSFRKGMEFLPHRLAQRLKGELLLNETVETIQADRNGVKVGLSSGRIMEGDHLFSTLPAPSLKKMLAPCLKEELDQIPGASVAVVSLGYRKKVLKREGFGYLIPTSEGERVMGVVFDSSVFPEQTTHPDDTRLSVMIGEKGMADFDNWTHGQFLAASQEALSRHLGIEEVPHLSAIKVAKKAIPQYFVGHLDRVAAIEREIASRFPRLTISGSSFYGVSVNDCIAHCKKITSPLD